MEKAGKQTKNGLRVIKTARTVKAINQAAREGFRLVLKKHEPSPEISEKYAVFQNKATGEIRVSHDFRDGPGPGDVEVLGWTQYYPYSYPNPFAAYLIPPDIALGERVWVKDLIEDIRGSTWNQGDAFRLDSAEAIWNGKDLEIQFDPLRDAIEMVG